MKNMFKEGENTKRVITTMTIICFNLLFIKFAALFLVFFKLSVWLAFSGVCLFTRVDVNPALQRNVVTPAIMQDFQFCNWS